MKVRVGHLIYTVTAAPAEFMDTHGGKETPEEDTVVWGRHEPSLQANFLREGMSAEMQAATLLHELMHAMYAVYNIADKRDEEYVVSHLDTPLTMLIQDNPGLFGKIEEAALGDRPLFPEIVQPVPEPPMLPTWMRKGVMDPQTYKGLTGCCLPAGDLSPSSMRVADA